MQKDPSLESLRQMDTLYNTLEPIAQIDPDAYFLYGSSAQSVVSGRILSRPKERFADYPPLRDIDLAVFEGAMHWTEIQRIAQSVIQISNGEFCLDPHLIRNDPEIPGNSKILNASVPSRWLAPKKVDYRDLQLSLIDPASALMIRMIYAEARIRDTRRIIAEISEIKDWHDERLRFGATHLLSTPNFRRKAPIATVKLLLGLLPESAQDQLRLYWRRKIPDIHLGTGIIRNEPEYL